MAAIADDGGPIKVIVSADDSHNDTNLAFSDKKPYPGWIACAPLLVAMSNTCCARR